MEGSISFDEFRSLGKTADLVEVRWSPTAPKLLVVLPLEEEDDEVYA